MENRTEEEILNIFREEVLQGARRVLRRGEDNFLLGSGNGYSANLNISELVPNERIPYFLESQVYLNGTEFLNGISNLENTENSLILRSELDNFLSRGEYELFYSINDSCRDYQRIALNSAGFIPWISVRQSAIPEEVRERNRTLARDNLFEILEISLDRNNLNSLVENLNDIWTHHLYEARS